MQRRSSWALVALCLAVAEPAALAGRALQQTDALSNSNGCLGAIPKCEAGACAIRNVMGVARWVCLRCSGNYEPVITNDGQDNIIQCVCPRGFYEATPGANTCSRCPAGQFCPGGDKVENPTSRGGNVTCGDNLVTRNDGARSQSDCVAPAGYAMTSPTAAAACGTSTYAPAFNRLGRCLRCQSGLEEPTNSTLTAGQRVSRRAVCKVPPGKFMSQGLVRICPQGFFREQWVDFNAANGTLCLPCKPGITTNGAGAGLQSLCNVVLAGYGIANVTNATNPPANVAPIDNSLYPNGLPEAALCGIGFYSYNGQCVNCPTGTVTLTLGAKSVEECMVPPGYALPSGGVMTPCANGTFREGWVMYSDPKAATCTPCGAGISSEARDLDENPLAANGTLIRATSASCYVEAGYGMIVQGKAFIGLPCPVNTYGAADKVYGWVSAPCKPCPRNMITDGATMVTNASVCINDDGFGYASEGASRCAPGFFSAKGSRKPCQQCPAGRTTTYVASQQRLPSDCFVKPGFGIVNGSAADPWNPDATGTDPATLPVLECPVGYYGAGGTMDSKCSPCTLGSSTEGAGSIAAANCTLCIPGYGIQGVGATTCTPCAYNTFHPGGSTTCSACPATMFYPPVDGAGARFNASGITLYTGSMAQDACVPQQSQLSQEAGQAYFADDAAAAGLFTNTSKPDLAACVTSCSAGKACMVQYVPASGSCLAVELDLAMSSEKTGTQLFYKLPPSVLGSASSVNKQQQQAAAKTLASGFYAQATVPTGSEATWATAGTNLGTDARTFVKLASGQTQAVLWAKASRAKCSRACDASNVCWGFLYNAAEGMCLYRGGVDALGTRAFFALPTAATGGYDALKW